MLKIASDRLSKFFSNIKYFWDRLSEFLHTGSCLLDYLPSSRRIWQNIMRVYRDSSFGEKSNNFSAVVILYLNDITKYLLNQIRMKRNSYFEFRPHCPLEKCRRVTFIRRYICIANTSNSLVDEDDLKVRVESAI